MLEFRPAQAYWNHRHILAQSRDRILQLAAAVGRGSDLLPFQWAQVIAVAIEFAPDLILELGRERGNSTAAFAEASHLTGGGTKVLSLCLSSAWQQHTLPRVRALAGDEWLTPLTILTTEILGFDYESALKSARRVLVFWDAHGFDIAECVLGTILPLLADRPHLVIMHDLSDARYDYPGAADYGENGIWKGRNDWSGPRVRLGNVDSAVEQAVAAVDFTTRNGLTLDSGDHSFHTELSEAQAAEMHELLGPLFGRSAHWFYFSLNEHAGPYRFPAVTPQIDVVIPVSGDGSDLVKTLRALNESALRFRAVLLCGKPGSRALTALEGLVFDKLNLQIVPSGERGSLPPMVAGLRASTAGAVATLPQDGSASVPCLGTMAAMIHSGYALVSGNRLMGGKGGCSRGETLLARVAAFPLRHIARLPVGDATNVFRMYSRRALREIAIESSRGFAYNVEILAKCHRAGLRAGDAAAPGGRGRFAKRLLAPRDWSMGYLRWLLYALGTTYLGRRQNTGGSRDG